MYNIEDKFLYEVFEDYKDEADDNVKKEIIQSFCKKLWQIKNSRQSSEKKITYKVAERFNGEIADIFKKYSEVTYKTVKTFTNNNDSWHILKQKINNIFTNMCDGSVCLKRDYLDCLHTPKRLYFRLVKGEEFEAKQLENEILKSFETGNLLYEKYAKQKLVLSWNSYKNLINEFIEKIFINYVPLSEYESADKVVLDITYWSEDNYVISYIGKSLSGYMRNYQKEYYGVKEHKTYNRCECGILFEKNNNKQKYCKDCSQYKPIETKIIICIDCGKELEVDARNMKTSRCSSCQNEKDKQRKREWKRNKK
jgi:hypothetical protein